MLKQAGRQAGRQVAILTYACDRYALLYVYVYIYIYIYIYTHAYIGMC